MSTGYDCDWVQGLCYSVPGRGSPYKTISDCITSCSQYCHLPDFMKLGDTEVPVPNSCRKRLVEYYDARRNPGCPTSMVECQTQFQPVSGPMAGMAQTTPYIHLTPTMTLDGHGDAIHQAYSTLAMPMGDGMDQCGAPLSSACNSTKDCLNERGQDPCGYDSPAVACKGGKCMCGSKQVFYNEGSTMDIGGGSSGQCFPQAKCAGCQFGGCYLSQRGQGCMPW